MRDLRAEIHSKIIYYRPQGEGNVFTGVCHFVRNQTHGYLVTAYPYYSAVGMHPTGMLSC